MTWLLWGLFGLCGIVLVGFVVLPAFGLGVAVVAWLAMAVLIGIMVRRLFGTKNFRL